SWLWRCRTRTPECGGLMRPAVALPTGPIERSSRFRWRTTARVVDDATLLVTEGVCWQHGPASTLSMERWDGKHQYERDGDRHDGRYRRVYAKDAPKLSWWGRLQRIVGGQVVRRIPVRRRLRRILAHACPEGAPCLWRVRRRMDESDAGGRGSRDGRRSRRLGDAQGSQQS